MLDDRRLVLARASSRRNRGPDRAASGLLLAPTGSKARARRAAPRGPPRSRAARQKRPIRRSPPSARARAHKEWRAQRRLRPTARCARPRAIAPRDRRSRPTRARAMATRGREEVVGDEAPHRRADAPLVLRNDRGMGNRQPEGTAKKRDDREPVGAGAHHAGFRERAKIGRPDPARGRAPHGEIDRRHQNEQHRGDRAHATQLRTALGLSLKSV